MRKIEAGLFGLLAGPPVPWASICLTSVVSRAQTRRKSQSCFRNGAFRQSRRALLDFGRHAICVGWQGRRWWNELDCYSNSDGSTTALCPKVTRDILKKTEEEIWRSDQKTPVKFTLHREKKGWGWISAD